MSRLLNWNALIKIKKKYWMHKTIYIKRWKFPRLHQQFYCLQNWKSKTVVYLYLFLSINIVDSMSGSVEMCSIWKRSKRVVRKKLQRHDILYFIRAFTSAMYSKYFVCRVVCMIQRRMSDFSCDFSFRRITFSLLWYGAHQFIM